MAWKPIESAPKDGTVIKAMAVVVIGGDQQTSSAKTKWAKGSWQKENGGTWSPTHWKPAG